MNRLLYIFFAVAAVGATTLVSAADNTLKMMDTNGDGLISKAEYMKHHERMWAIFRKNKDGLVMMEDMRKAPGGAWKDDKSVKDVKAAK